MAPSQELPNQDDGVPVLQERLRLAHQARRAKEHQLDDIRRALCDAGFMEDDDPYGHADLADVIRQARGPEPDTAAPDQRSYPITSPEWRTGEGFGRCAFRMSTGDGILQCTFRAGHPPHGHRLNATNPGTPEPHTAPDQATDAAAALAEVLTAFTPVSSHTGTRLGWTTSLPVTEQDYARWNAALYTSGARPTADGAS